jgi:hypothetical protein
MKVIHKTDTRLPKVSKVYLFVIKQADLSTQSVAMELKSYPKEF